MIVFCSHALRMKHLFTLMLLLAGSALIAQIDSTETEPSEDDSLSFGLLPISPQRAKHFFLDVELGYLRSYHEVRGNKYRELWECRGGHETRIFAPTAELRAGYQIKNWWSVSAGVQYFQTGFDFTETKTLQDSVDVDIVIGCDSYGADNSSFGFMYTGFYDPRFLSYVKGPHPDQATMNIRLRYFYIGLPVKTEFSAFIRTTRMQQFKLFVTGVVSPNYIVKQRYDVSFQSDGWNFVERDSVGVPAPYIRRWNLGGGYGLGFSLLVRKQFEMRLEFNRQEQLLYLFNWRLFQKDDYQERHAISSAKFSLRYYFGE
jgi:hypothetical protein